jgi:hypothetical protein
MGTKAAARGEVVLRGLVSSARAGDVLDLPSKSAPEFPFLIKGGYGGQRSEKTRISAGFTETPGHYAEGLRFI